MEDCFFFLVRNVQLFLSEVKNAPLGCYLYVYNFSFQEQTDKINAEVSYADPSDVEMLVTTCFFHSPQLCFTPASENRTF